MFLFPHPSLSEYIWAVGPLALGWVLDMALGDPERLPHPVVFFGKTISALERKMNRGGNRVLKGGICAVSLVIAVYLLTALLLKAVSFIGILEFVVRTVLIYFCLAGKTLRKEVKGVFDSFSGGLDAARRRVSRIVGRDTACLSEQEVKTAALETLAENLSDGVAAPMFWYLLLGVPGMMAYKMVNTLDSMIGYRNERYLLFGRVAARMDDVANWIPARLTAVLIAVAGESKRAFQFISKYGHCHASPNSGYPEAALAGVLDCRFGGTHSYFGKDFYKPYIGSNPRSLTCADMHRSLRVCLLAEILMLLLVLSLRLI